MSLAAGTRLGPYEILSPIGAGGMGEVYRAKDTRLDRLVAVKVLAAHLSASPEVRQRFEREARTISKLSHPHICALYDVGEAGGSRPSAVDSPETIQFLVMEYLEGETLAERLVKGSLPLDDTLRFGAQIADALDKAHRQGIVHRDLKPGPSRLCGLVSLCACSNSRRAGRGPAGTCRRMTDSSPSCPRRARHRTAADRDPQLACRTGEVT